MSVNFSSMKMSANASEASVATTPAGSARPSISSERSVKKSKFQRFLDEFKPVEVPQTPVSIYGPLVAKKVPMSEVEKQDSYGRKMSEAYAKFKTAVGYEPVVFR